MHIREKVNLKKYFLISGLVTLACLIGVRTVAGSAGILIVYVTTVINQLLLVEGVACMASVAKTGDGFSNISKKIVLIFIGKIFILFLGLSLSIHLMGKWAIIPLVNYIVMVFILVLSMKKAAD